MLLELGVASMDFDAAAINHTENYDGERFPGTQTFRLLYERLSEADPSKSVRGISAVSKNPRVSLRRIQAATGVPRSTARDTLHKAK